MRFILDFTLASITLGLDLTTTNSGMGQRP